MELTLAAPARAPATAAPLLSLSRMTVDFPARGGGLVRVLHGIDLDIAAGETLGLVGESGSGKSITCLAALRLLPEEARIGGRVDFDGEDIAGMAPARLQSLRGARIAMTGAQPQVLEVFETMALLDLIPHAPDTAAVLALLGE